MWFLAPSIWVACTSGTGGGPRVPIDWGDVPTDTFPQFYGRAPKNLLMISMDTFRRDHLGRYGDVGASPFLTTLANDGVALDDHVQCSNWTFAATSCTLAGRYNEEAGQIPKLSDVSAEPWALGTPFLATYLQDLGFYSVLASSNGWLAPEWMNTQGYDVAFLPTTGKASGVYHAARNRLDAALAEGKADRWFLHVHLTEPHAPYSPDEDYLGGLDELEPIPFDLDDRDEQYQVTREVWPEMTDEEQAQLVQHLTVRYAAEIQYLDDQIFDMFTDLDADGLLEDTLIVFWTDHGEAFFEHDYQTHAYTLHREENDALLFFWSKNIVTAAWDQPTTAIDMVPTLLGLYGLPIPPTVTGTPVGEAPADRARFASTVARLGTIHSVQKNGWKLVFSWSGSVRLYDLNADPLETTSLYDPTAPSPEAQDLWNELWPIVELAIPLIPEYHAALPVELMAGLTSR